MTMQERTVSSRTEIFTEAMARLASGVAVVTSRHRGGAPCGLLVSSICSYSVRPPSVLVSIGRESRSYPALLGQADFGVHLLGSGDGPIARVFASRGEDKFAGLDWAWDDSVPRLENDVLVYLRCVRRRVFEHADHAIVIGEVADGQISHGEPLVYYRRALDWRLEPPGHGRVR
ncbi:flavin reductase family protein [Plantactinospora sp. KBS50]|uniref:flavin reductase family protein n=1 Tax=Plantactinospora sp. KBS50 TaxID=2024580 RepID=UPI0012FDE445|nr:flavin reductase family protein [Plantactinospora sp. KBS50]